ncbi:MAG: polysaccharide pyruvyl transferase family protein [Acidimicrobiia bacterium]|nr:polysaccharide pyruvyl transferase family protein [Acidimicrobiia bacterium]
MAFALGPLERPTPPTTDVVWLSRSDGEALHPPPTDALGTAEVVDWLEPLPGEDPWPAGARRAYECNAVLLARMRRGEPATGRWWRPAARTFGPLAEAWLHRGLRVLSRGKVVVTDRLHAHVVALAAGIPSVVLDNSYGKVHGVVAASTAASPLTHRAETAEDAWEQAAALAGVTVDRPEARP